MFLFIHECRTCPLTLNTTDFFATTLHKMWVTSKWPNILFISHCSTVIINVIAPDTGFQSTTVLHAWVTQLNGPVGAILWTTKEIWTKPPSVVLKLGSLTLIASLITFRLHSPTFELPFHSQCAHNNTWSVLLILFPVTIPSSCHTHWNNRLLCFHPLASAIVSVWPSSPFVRQVSWVPKNSQWSVSEEGFVATFKSLG